MRVPYPEASRPMPAPAKKARKRGEDAKKARRENLANKEKENKATAKRKALKRINARVEEKYEKEKEKFPKPGCDELRECLRTSPLVRAMLEAGTLEPLKGVRMKHYSFLAPVLGNATHWLTIIVRNGLEKFQISLQDPLELQILTVFSVNEWDEHRDRRAELLSHVLEANEYLYAKSLWGDGEVWKRDWIERKTATWQLMHPLRTRQTQERLNKIAEKKQEENPEVNVKTKSQEEAR